MDTSDLVKFRVERSFISLYKEFLEIIDELKADFQDNHERLKKTYKLLSKEDNDLTIPLEQSKWLDDAKHARVRKNILDKANAVLRDLNSELEHYKISL